MKTISFVQNGHFYTLAKSLSESFNFTLVKCEAQEPGWDAISETIKILTISINNVMTNVETDLKKHFGDDSVKTYNNIQVVDDNTGYVVITVYGNIFLKRFPVN